jgi:hypothetical protein
VLNVEVMLCGVTRNSEMSMYRPLVRCSVHCAGRPPQRTRRPRQCTRHLRSQRRKAGLRLPPCAVSPRHRPPHMCLSRSRSRSKNSNLRGERKRKRPGSGQRRYMIIRVRCVGALPSPLFFFSVNERHLSFGLVCGFSRSQVISIYERARVCS